MSENKTQKVTIPFLRAQKERKEKILALTAYDFPIAKILDEAGIDIILVGDSLAMVVLGYENTIPVTMDEMIHHTKPVARAVKRALVVGDMPYFSFHRSVDETVFNASRFIKEAGAGAVKIEGASRKRLLLTESLIEAEIPVMGHVGLTPQSIHHLGRFKVKGKEAEDADKIVEDALNLEKAGVFSIVLECVPMELARIITEKVKIPTIGIGAGPYCDGQILVFHDLIGLANGYSPKFVKKYANAQDLFSKAVKDYISDVRVGKFPDAVTSYQLSSKKILEELLEKKRKVKKL
ncbi:3-methyl-2-oxobutanoate hydroxymethyltransferase [Acidobacteriota bacterium]